MEQTAVILIDAEDWRQVKETQLEILRLLKTIDVSKGIPQPHLTVKEYLSAVKIGRTKFDQLVAANKIKILKKRRKIYVPTSEVDRYFADSSIR